MSHTPATIPPRNGSALRQWLDQERGRGASLARRIGCSRSYLSKIAAGRARNPSLSLCNAIAQATGLPLESITAPCLSSESRQHARRSDASHDATIGPVDAAVESRGGGQ